MRPCVTWISFFISRHAEQEKATMEAELFFKPLLGDLSVWVRVESALDPKFRTVCAFFFFPIDDTIRRDFRNKSSSHLYNMNPLWPWSLLKKKKKNPRTEVSIISKKKHIQRTTFSLLSCCFLFFFSHANKENPQMVQISVQFGGSQIRGAALSIGIGSTLFYLYDLNQPSCCL